MDLRFSAPELIPTTLRWRFSECAKYRHGCASFAPTFTPDDKKILFASNKHKCDSSLFELYLVNTDGRNVEQMTSFGKFTSFPEFSPDGKKLIFSSSFQSKGNYEFNIFSVDWKP